MKMKKATSKALIVGLAAAMALGSVACADKNASSTDSTSSSSSSAAVSESSSKTEPTSSSSSSSSAASSSTEQPTADTVPSPDLEGAYTAETEQLAWVKSHNSSDFSLDDLKKANTTQSLVQAGSGKVAVTSRKIFKANAANDGLGELIFHTDFYRWIDEDGAIHWFRDTHGYDFESYVIIYPNGLAYRYNWKGSDPASYIVYANPESVVGAYSMCPVFETAVWADGTAVEEYDGSADPKYTQGAEYVTQILSDSQSGEQLNVYMSANMQMLSMLNTTAWGSSDFTTQRIVDELPDLSARLQVFENIGMIDSKMVINGVEYDVKLADKIQNMIMTGTDNATITSETPVYLDGEDTTTLTNGGRFLISGENVYTVNF